MNNRERGVSSLVPMASLRRHLGGTKSLATNGGSLILNVLVSGVGGFVFWIMVANAAPKAAVAQGAALVSAMLGVMVISQQSVVANVPPLIAASPRPRRFALQFYAAASVITAVVAAMYVVIGPEVADGLSYLRDDRLGLIFFAGCLLWSVFALQDAVLSGIARGELVLAENTVWGLLRLAIVGLLPVIGIQLGVELIVLSWLIPAAFMVVAVNYFLFVAERAPLRKPLGTHEFHRRDLFVHLGFEQVTAILAGMANLVLPAVVLTSLGATRSAPFLAAWSFIQVSERAMSTFAGAFAVEIRRAGRVKREAINLTVGFMVAFALAAVVGAQLFADDPMSLLGKGYGEDGGRVLAVLVFGTPLRVMSMLSAATNRVYGAGWRNLVQQTAYSAALYLSLVLIPLDSGTAVAWCIVIAKASVAIVGTWHVVSYIRRDVPLPGSERRDSVPDDAAAVSVHDEAPANHMA